jgi:peptidoglycan/LPS O-acetylase OafA/YrhL
MNRGFSSFLDVTRFSAAVVVLLSHYGSEQITHSIFYVFSFIAHSAVMVFFVLSGYVIAYITEEKERDLPRYALSRFCRIYSVVAPAVLLTVVFDLWGRSINPAPYSIYQYFETNAGIYQVLSSLFFLGESWFFGYPLFSNGAFWSLNNEVWYYIAFAILFWCRTAWLRYLLVLGAAIFAGWKIVMLSPVWFFGVAVRRLEKRFDLGKAASLAIFVACLLTILICDGLERGTWDFPAIEGPRLSLFGTLVTVPVRDYVTGLLVSLMFLAAARLLRDVVPTPTVRRAISGCAQMTFSIYLFHRPIMFFLAAALPGSIEDNGKRVAILGITIIVIVALSFVTELQKDRLKAWLTTLFQVNRWRQA